VPGRHSALPGSILLSGFAAAGVAACFAFLSPPARAADSSGARASWSWSAQETTIRSPKFSPDGHSLVAEVRHFITMRASLSKKEFNERYGKAFQRDPRFADPTIALLRITDGSRQDLGYGFDPVFSPDGRQVVFEQLNPTAKFFHFNENVKPRANNGLAVYDLESRQLRRVAEPATSHCIRPIFSPDGKSVVFGTPVPDSPFRWDHPVSLEQIELASGKRTTLYARQETFGEPHFLREFAFVGERLLARRSVAVAQSGPLDGLRLEELIDPITGAVVYSWGEQDYNEVAYMRFSRWRDGTPAVFTRQWAPVASAPKPQRRKDLLELLRRTGVVAPDGLLVARGDDFEVIVEDLATGERVARFDAIPGNDGHAELELAWSADSKRLAWVDAGVEGPRGYDVLRVETVSTK